MGRFGNVGGGGGIQAAIAQQRVKLGVPGAGQGGAGGGQTPPYGNVENAMMMQKPQQQGGPQISMPLPQQPPGGGMQGLAPRYQEMAKTYGPDFAMKRAAAFQAGQLPGQQGQAPGQMQPNPGGGGPHEMMANIAQVLQQRGVHANPGMPGGGQPIPFNPNQQGMQHSVPPTGMHGMYDLPQGVKPQDLTSWPQPAPGGPMNPKPMRDPNTGGAPVMPPAPQPQGGGFANADPRLRPGFQGPLRKY